MQICLPAFASSACSGLTVLFADLILAFLLNGRANHSVASLKLAVEVVHAARRTGNKAGATVSVLSTQRYDSY